MFASLASAAAVQRTGIDLAGLAGFHVPVPGIIAVNGQPAPDATRRGLAGPGTDPHAE